MNAVKKLIADLVGHATVSDTSNLEIQNYIEAYLKFYGITVTRVYNDAGDKANLYASIGPDVAGGVVLSGHTDVVPVVGQAWSSDPFKVVEKDDRLYGRGTCDMKSFLAIALSLVPDMQAANMKRPIHLAFSYDEEVGCLGAPRMIDDMVAKLPPIDAVIVGEPTLLEIANAHKGVRGYRFRFRGVEAHSSQPHRGVSAIEYATKLMAEIYEIRDELTAKPFTGTSFEPPYSTLNVGMINGGTAHNIIAKECAFTVDYRYIPQDDRRAVIDRIDLLVGKLSAAMQKDHPDAGIDVDIAEIPAFRAETDSNAEMLCRQLSGKNNTLNVSYGTEAGQFQERGYSTIVCGPGSIDQAHKPDEYIELEQVKKGVQFIKSLINRQKN
ncbi:MAG: acetylornithine deacetylase [Rhodobacterales bacterium]